MGLTNSSVGAAAWDSNVPQDVLKTGRLIALAGNPNVGKTTLFNALTNLHQHTGNWPGKTVGSAYGTLQYHNQTYIITDIPGTYSLLARSNEEIVARDALLFGGAEIILVVCDATCLQRTISLALQVLEITGNVIICVNLMDEAKRNGIIIDLPALEKSVGVPVIGMSAGKREGISDLLNAIENFSPRQPRSICPGWDVTSALEPLTAYFSAYHPALPPFWIAERVCEGDCSMLECLCAHLGMDLNDEELSAAREQSLNSLASAGIPPEHFCDICVQKLSNRAASICNSVVYCPASRTKNYRCVDRILTHPLWGWAIMFLLLAGILWLTICGANYPSQLLSSLLFSFGELLRLGLEYFELPPFTVSLLIDGIYKTTAWVVSVMLPPMLIFFPLFTLLEDLGYLPRAAFNLDGLFKHCNTCGKQSLTTCMGFGCNAAGVIGCRIIDSPRERLIAILTNSFVPCNGRFPTMIALITIFFAGSRPSSRVLAALMLSGLVIFGFGTSLLCSKLLSVTVLKGIPSSFTLELPPFRRPRFGEVLLRSFLDRTVFVLVRALKAAAPTGLILWLLANLAPGGRTLLSIFCEFLDPAATFLGLDGAILLAFFLGLPANEIVLPVLLMCYLSGSSLLSYASLPELRDCLINHGWTAATAACVLVFSLLHWPCATTLMTIRKETGSRKYTLLAAALPTAFGIFSCLLIRLLT